MSPTIGSYKDKQNVVSRAPHIEGLGGYLGALTIINSSNAAATDSHTHGVPSLPGAGHLTCIMSFNFSARLRLAVFLSPFS